jgi:hypothetical protein
MAIAEHPVLSNRSHGNVLPAAWTTLYQLSLAPPEVVEGWIEDGTIHPKIERKQVIELLPPRPKKKAKKAPTRSELRREQAMEAAARKRQAERAEETAEAAQFCAELVKLDRAFAQRLLDRGAERVWFNFVFEHALCTALENSSGNAGNDIDAEQSADKRRERFAALDEGTITVPFRIVSDAAR